MQSEEKCNGFFQKILEYLPPDYGFFAASCRLLFPHFKNTDKKSMDFNDLHVLVGLEEVRKQIDYATLFLAQKLYDFCGLWRSVAFVALSHWI